MSQNKVQRLFREKCHKDINCEDLVGKSKKFYNYDKMPPQSQRLFGYAFYRNINNKNNI